MQAEYTHELLHKWEISPHIALLPILDGGSLKRFFLDQNSGMEGTTRKIYSFSNRPAKTDVQKDPSPWPILGSLRALATTIGGMMYMHSFQGGATLLSLGLIFILYAMFVWWRDVLRESTLEGHHTKVIQLGPRYGFILFIVSEVMFLFALFRASFHSSLAPTVEIGGTLFSIICGIRQYLGHLTKEHHIGFEAAAWYWHFVDVVQLFPFVFIYWWGEQIKEPNGSNSSLASTKEIGLALQKERSALI
ncbi:cytochrome c oxidase subunit 3 [Tanacetum coccineum]